MPLEAAVVKKKNYILEYLQNSPIQCFASTIYLYFLFELNKLMLIFEFLVLKHSPRSVTSLMSRVKFLHWEKKRDLSCRNKVCKSLFLTVHRQKRTDYEFLSSVLYCAGVAL